MESFLLSTAGDQGSTDRPQSDEVRAELERMLASPDFPASVRRKKLLRYLVEESLAGRGDQLKGYTVALAVLGRGENFDPQSDPIVRIEARRLRADIDRYYMSAGHANPLRLSIPKGRYVPEIHRLEPVFSPIEDDASAEVPADTANADETTTEPTSNRLRWIVAATFVGIVVCGAVAYVLLFQWRSQPESQDTAYGGPAIVVLPFESLDPSNDGHYLAAGVSQELVNVLKQFPGFRLYARPVTAKGERDAPPAHFGQGLGVTYVVAGTVSEEVDSVHVTVQLFEDATNRVLWSRSYHRPRTPADLIAIQGEVAAEIATEIGQPNGVVSSDLQMRMTMPEVSNMQSYVCVLRGYAYRRKLAREEFDSVLTCLEDAVRRDPDYGDAWAMLGWLYLDAGRYGYANDAAPADYYDRATQAASRALELEPTNTLGLKALSAINHFQGNFDEGDQLARLALEQNPYDPDSLIQLGWRLAIRGHFQEGVPLIERAIARSVNPPAWYFHPLAIHHLMRGDSAAMLDAAKRGTGDGSARGQAFLAMAYGLTGNQEAARKALLRMNEITPGYDLIAHFRTYQATDKILDAFAMALDQAGWQASP